MRAVIQRVSRADVRVDGAAVASIGGGVVVLVGVAAGDTAADADALGAKIAALRIFPDEVGKMNLSLTDTGGSAIVVSQFTLLADVRRGRRPSFTGAEDPERAAPLVDRVAGAIAASGVPVRSGRFGERMEVDLVNDGPVTIVLEVLGGMVG
ncbi:MAG TPA: D-aminoacyl-tRNA deacylase [Acidimicrobiia bacterium]